MPLGDSITAGYKSSTGNGYRGDLYSSLSTQVGTVDMVGTLNDGPTADPDHEGHSGYEIAQIAALTNTALASYKPNVVLLLAGINDLRLNDDVANAPNRLASLIDQIFSNEPDATVLVAKLIVNATPSVESQVVTFNNALPGIINSRASAGKHIILVDTSALTTSDLSDGLHPNDGGYQKLSDAWDGAILTVIGNGWVKDPVAGSVTRPTGYVYSGISGECLDGGTLTSGAKVYITPCANAGRQQFNFNSGRVITHYLCLDVVGGGTGNGSLVDLYTCNGGANQQWTVQSNGTLKNPTSGRCLDDPGGNTSSQLDIWDCGSGTNQQFLAPAQGAITSGISGKCLDDKGGLASSGTHVDSYGCNNNSSQQWEIYNHTVRFDGKCVSVAGGGTGNGSLVDLESCSGAGSQTWTPVGGTLVNAGSGRCLDIPGSSTTNGIQLDILDCSGGSNQKWTIPNL
ncbi:MAG TPA: ricin-type beta-trefoil lectin domain protein [Acidobacteriaceae bacterium]|nr:ricin-type beta-trefoil lectin domain protein [Acidobacteriaceae bacterium]